MTVEEQLVAEQAEVGVTSQALLSGPQTLNSIVRIDVPAPATSVPMYTTAAGTVVARQLAKDGVAKIVVANPDPVTGRYRVEVSSPAVWGWVAANRLYPHHEPVTDIPAARNPDARASALLRARPAMGMSYWWGRGLWPVGGPTVLPADNRGRCTINAGFTGCPNCSHAATGGGTEYGSDCSQFVSTMWGFPDTDSTRHTRGDGFQASTYCRDANDQGTPFQWATVTGGNPPRASHGFTNAYEGDAIVKNDLPEAPGVPPNRDECDHIFMIAKRRPVGSNLFKTYECRSCDRGCMPFERTIANGDATWHVIRRSGW